MRKRTVQLNIHPTEAENQRLKQHNRKSGLTVSAYVRLLINGFHPKETPPIDYHKLMTGLYELNAKLPQSALERGEP
ncbi:MAG TPA: plasmid mobilization relaxosome protein MobC [Firmicutes bacterium]|nr:plasmid mobilization relaxosome protein MobC [Bacillota bacterium]